MASALVDASAMVAVFGAHRASAAHCRGLLALAACEGGVLSSTRPCVAEACHLLAAPQRHAPMQRLAAGAVSIHPIQQELLADRAPAMRRHAERPRTEMDLADALLCGLAADTRVTRVTRVMALDARDFSRCRLPGGRAFEWL